jgi:hypothetical protein
VIEGGSFSTHGDGIDIDQSKSSSGVAIALGYGKVVKKGIYIGAEYMQRISPNIEDKQKIVDIRGFIPTAALRLGRIRNGCLLYAKLGGAYNNRMRICGKTFGGVDLLYGGGIEKAIGRSFTLRLDFDVIAGKNYSVTRLTSGTEDRYGVKYSIRYSRDKDSEKLATGNAGGDEYALNDATYISGDVIANAPPLPADVNGERGLPPGCPLFEETIEVKRKSNFNVRLMFSYSL